jgi:hypothetical protein
MLSGKYLFTYPCGTGRKRLFGKRCRLQRPGNILPVMADSLFHLIALAVKAMLFFFQVGYTPNLSHIRPPY